MVTTRREDRDIKMNQLQSYLWAFTYKPLVYKIVTYSVSHSSESPLSWDSQCKSLASSASQYHLQIPEKQITEHSHNSSSYRLKSHYTHTHTIETLCISICK